MESSFLRMLHSHVHDGVLVIQEIAPHTSHISAVAPADNAQGNHMRHSSTLTGTRKLMLMFCTHPQPP